MACSLVDENQDFTGAFFLPPTKLLDVPFRKNLRISNFEYFSLHLFHELFTMAALKPPQMCFFLSFFLSSRPACLLACLLARVWFSTLRDRSCLNLGQAGEFSSHLCPCLLSSFLSFHSSVSCVTFPLSSNLTFVCNVFICALFHVAYPYMPAGMYDTETGNLPLLGIGNAPDQF
jgi:hypothetical protein